MFKLLRQVTSDHLMKVEDAPDDGDIIISSQNCCTQVNDQFGVDQALEIVGSMWIQLIHGVVIPTVKINVGSWDSKIVLLVHDKLVVLGINPGDDLFVRPGEDAESENG